MIGIASLRDAICDLRFLLNRGYNRDAALNLVANRHRLASRQRNFLLRAVFSGEEAKIGRRKITLEIKNKELIIDGYNVLITVETALKGEEAFLCDDGVVRDAAASYGKHRITNITEKATALILESLAREQIKSALFVFDSQVSKSGELCKLVRKKIANMKIRGEAKAIKAVDYALVQSKDKVVCSSDRAVIKKAKRVLDLPRLAIGEAKLIKLPECSD